MVEVHAGPAGSLIVQPVGDLCHLGVQALVETLHAAVRVGETTVCVDLSEVTLLSAAAVNTLVAAAVECRAAGGALSLTGATGLSARVLALTGLDALHGQAPRDLNARSAS